jgi:hypothetical protein
MTECEFLMSPPPSREIKRWEMSDRILKRESYQEALIEESRDRVERMMWANIALIDNEATVHLAQPQPKASQSERSKVPTRVRAFGLATAAIAVCAILIGMRFSSNPSMRFVDAGVSFRLGASCQISDFASEPAQVS